MPDESFNSIIKEVILHPRQRAEKLDNDIDQLFDVSHDVEAKITKFFGIVRSRISELDRNTRVAISRMLMYLSIDTSEDDADENEIIASNLLRLLHESYMLLGIDDSQQLVTTDEQTAAIKALADLERVKTINDNSSHSDDIQKLLAGNGQ